MLSVSTLNEQAKNLLEAHFGYVQVVGEISRLTKHGSGHWYFTLKDENASISAVMYKTNNTRVKFEVKDGLKVVIHGKISLYSPSGSYQLIANAMQPDGEGELELAFKQLKARLESEGLFDISRKKPLPKLPQKIALITSATSAALQDMLRIFNERYNLAKIFIFDALTQGENAPASLIRALKKADNYGVDMIILARGGGSREDLWCFNDESLARAIFDAKTPIVSAIGHEIDYVISDFVADFRAPTPTAAAALVPEILGLMQYLDSTEDALNNAINAKITNAQNRLNLLSAKFSPNAITAKIELKISELNSKKFMLKTAILNKINRLEARLNTAKNSLETAKIFYENTKTLIEIRQNGEKIALSELKIGDEVELISQTTTKKAKIIR